MDTRTSPSEHVKIGVLDALSAAVHMLEQGDLDDETVHDIRKNLKSARAGIRLLRPLDERIYQSENERLRDAGRRLSGVRDGKVLLGVLAGLLEKEKKPARRRLLEHLRARIEKQRD